MDTGFEESWVVIVRVGLRPTAAKFVFSISFVVWWKLIKGKKG